jgi:hypothetical protein
MTQTELTLDEWWTYAKHESIDVRYSILITHIDSIPIEILEYLATDDIFFIRCSVARNPNTAPQTLELLAQDENSDVRYWVARNPNTTEEIFLMVKAYNKFNHLVLR